MKQSPFVIVLLLSCCAAACGGGDDSGNDSGALVGVSMSSTVGVVLDEIPEQLRDQAAAFYLAEGDSFWRDRARFQIRHTAYRLAYRNFYYTDKGPLPLPPLQLWNIDFDPAGPVRGTYQGHDVVMIDYELESTILTDRDSPEAAERELRDIGGVSSEAFNLPLDPEFLFQRTGYACLNELGYPLRTAESENAWQLYDQDCGIHVPGEPGCHQTEFPDETCLEALQRHTGRVDTQVRFERQAWDAGVADDVRVADYAHTDGPDLEVIGDGLLNNWIVWRYIDADSCAIEEQCVGGPGWRRLLEFDASVRNASTEPLVIGEAGPGAPFVEHNNFIHSACHDHFHFRHYGDFSYDVVPGDKRAFCIESTDRYFNSEDTPLVHPYDCDFQGVASGWGDTYIAGIECNWIDITDLEIPSGGLDADLRFHLNPDDFICEGTPVLDEDGNLIFDPTEIVGENGLSVDRPRCLFVDGHGDNNFQERRVTVPRDGGLITAPCTRGQAGPLRDCGWEEQAENLTCDPGETVTLSCRSSSPSAPPQALRICEGSWERGRVIACMFREALATTIVDASPSEVSFTCPGPRPPNEPGGTYGWFSAGVLADASAASVTCEAVP